jgi:hypothetical protein
MNSTCDISSQGVFHGSTVLSGGLNFISVVPSLSTCGLLAKDVQIQLELQATQIRTKTIIDQLLILFDQSSN